MSIYQNKYYNSAMICFYLPSNISDYIEIDGGEKRKDLHITLFCIDDWIGLSPDKKINAFKFLKETCAKQKSLKGQISGIGCFNNPKSDVFYLSIDVPGLETLRENLSKIDLPYDTNHGFTPHITLKYLEKDELLPYPKLKKPIPLDLKFVTLTTKGTERFNFPLLG